MAFFHKRRGVTRFRLHHSNYHDPIFDPTSGRANVPHGGLTSEEQEDPFSFMVLINLEQCLFTPCRADVPLGSILNPVYPLVGDDNNEDTRLEMVSYSDGYVQFNELERC